MLARIAGTTVILPQRLLFIFEPLAFLLLRGKNVGALCGYPVNHNEQRALDY